MASRVLLVFSLLLLLFTACCHTAGASDADPLQDFCVADVSSHLQMNGFPCRDPAAATSLDFSSTLIASPGKTSNPLGSSVTLADAATFPALNTFGVSLARLDFAPAGLIPPHVHPRASELLYLQSGALNVGFITTDNRLFARNISQGQIFIFPRGLVHFQLNIDGQHPAIAIAALTSQNPGTSLLATALFASTPGVEDVVLEKAFGVGKDEIERLRAAVRST